tara:strand:- start:272 stop:682 length:411 start_codon:yes stop_codon:yes gene_type:complete
MITTEVSGQAISIQFKSSQFNQFVWPLTRFRFASLGAGGYYVYDEDGQLLKHIPEYSAIVGCLSKNIIIQGSDRSNRDQFGMQIVFSNSIGEFSSNILKEKNTLVGMMEHVEVRRGGQGLKLVSDGEAKRETFSTT